MNIDKAVNSCPMPYTEKDSPFFGRDYNSLMDSQKKIHDSYVRGEVSRMRLEEAFEIQQKTHSRMQKYKRNYIKRNYGSHVIANELILNS